MAGVATLFILFGFILVFDVFPQFPAIQMVENSVSCLVEHSLKQDCSHHNGDCERRSPPEKQVVNTLCQRHVGRW
uniref:Secreted protein n=1 Tax=Anguilla anguilla TaxID=7936 RepID=A0A0E9X034_ANGAN